MAIKSDRKRKLAEKCSKPPSRFYGIFLAILALAFGILHYLHVSTLFENDRHFSHLSEIEREMSFRTEMGMYYSYYKTIVESDTFLDGMEKIKRDNLTAYPSTINAAKKFTLLPEILIGLLYHILKLLGITPKRLCWQIERGDGLSQVTSCEGLGEPIYFYLEIVWYCSAATVTLLFLYASHLSESIYGGIIAVGLFFYNHTDCTRVQWTPPLRENFGYPLLLYQMYHVSIIIGNYTKNRKFALGDMLNFVLTPASVFLSLSCWQFSQFVFATQVIALLILKWTNVIPNELYIRLCLMHTLPIALYTTLFDNSLTLCSLYTCLLFTSNLCSLLAITLPKKLRLPFEIIGTLIGTKLLKSYVLKIEDDAHVFDLLRAKLTNYKTFHTLLYTCSNEFDFLPYETYEAIVRTLLLPTAIISGVLILYYWYRIFRINGYPTCIESDVAYNVLQTGAFVVMAVFIMRLKLFMTPHLCIIAALVAKKKYLEQIEIRNQNIRLFLLVLLFACMTAIGVQRIQEEHKFIGEYSNIEQEQLLDWIQKKTPSTAVFAGKMSLMANVMLSTRRPIVNNPYYEDKEMRDRTLKVYEIFSRKEVSTVYDTLLKLGVDYVILEEYFCYDVISSTPGCKMTDLWDHVDKRNRRRPPVCPILCQGNPYPFRRVFVNRRYVVLRLERSTSVEFKPKVATHYQF